MAVEIRNDSSFPLVWATDSMKSGDWTDPWYPSRASPIAPGATAEWRAEGDLTLVPTSGTEGKVYYNVNGDPARQLYIYFNSPLVESPYGNTFHIRAPPGFEAAFSGGQGHHARLTIRFRETARRRVPNFTPSVNGFQFRNSWKPGLPAMTLGFLWNRLLDELGEEAASVLALARVDDGWLPITQARAGMCGGMTFGAMDYFAAGKLPPATTTAPDSETDPLFQFIRDRLLDSFDITGSGHRWLGYSSPHYPNGDEGVIQLTGLARGRSWVTYRDEWPRIRDDIDAGRLSPIGLIQTDSLDIGDNHQVLAYAYEQSGQEVKLWVYDNNYPGEDDLHLKFDITHTTGEVHVERLGPWRPGEPRIFCIFRTDGYNPHTPPDGRPLPPPTPAPVEMSPADTIRALGGIGVDFSVAETDLRDWLGNPQHTPYPAFAQALLSSGWKLKAPVFLDVIAWNYEHTPGVASPRRSEEVDREILKAAVLEGSNVRHGTHLTNFDELLAP
ncbi:hypothetical protein O7599_09605 [Streptomyces sp. WMMC500]|uniref:hypothetical protein n=1 Tax=Streptomyces sp. WMMC500 TaxID=3015154 RepID=UPI00248BF6B2|nr:hypothetical protein [Streptomyces sp. WMMC500]WBB62763.1 hypothetical protein O7599_09605 [Streptomyces sp. WMMC500]